jgi:hypothetical protein
MSNSALRVGSDFALSLFTMMQVAKRCQMLSSTTKIQWRDVQWLIKAGATDLVQ